MTADTFQENASAFRLKRLGVLIETPKRFEEDVTFQNVCNVACHQYRHFVSWWLLPFFVFFIFFSTILLFIYFLLTFVQTKMLHFKILFLSLAFLGACTETQDIRKDISDSK